MSDKLCFCSSSVIESFIDFSISLTPGLGLSKVLRLVRFIPSPLPFSYKKCGWYVRRRDMLYVYTDVAANITCYLYNLLYKYFQHLSTTEIILKIDYVILYLWSSKNHFIEIFIHFLVVLLMWVSICLICHICLISTGNQSFAILLMKHKVHFW